MKKSHIISYTLLILFVISCKTKLYRPANSLNNNNTSKQVASTSMLPASLSGYNLSPAYIDQFNQIKGDDWTYRNGYFKNFGAGSKPSSVNAHDDTLHITYKRVADTLEGGGLISKHLFGYGYYEIKAKLYSATPGFHQSFFAQGQDYNKDYYRTPKTDTLPYFGVIQEIDCFEVESESTNTVGQNFHTGYPVKSDIAKLASGHNTADWFTAGFEWLPGKVRYFIDGVKTDSITYLQSYCPTNLWITALPRPKVVHRYPKGIPDPVAGAEMLVDYIKYYNKELNNVNLIGNPSFEYNNSFRGHTDDPSFVNHPVGWIVSPNGKYTTGASIIINDKDNPGSNTSSKWKLKLGINGSYETLTHQNLEYIPHGYYTLTAYVKPSANAPMAYMDAFPDHLLTGRLPSVTDSLKADMSLFPNQWVPIVIPNIHVTNGKLSIGLIANGRSGQSVKIDSVDLQNINNHQVLIDNSSPGFKTDTSPWSIETGKDGQYGDNYLTINGLGHWAKWTPVIPSNGRYNVYLRSNRKSNSIEPLSLNIFSNGTVSKAEVNQHANAGAWIYIGTYNFPAGSGNYVQLNTTAGRNVADAALFVKI